MKKLIKSSKEVEYVSESDYDQAFREIWLRYHEDGIDINNDSESGIVDLQINWAGLGNQTPEEARVFAKKLTAASEECINFPYNGMKIAYED